MELLLAIMLVAVLLATIKRRQKRSMAEDSQEYLARYHADKKPRS